jgi:hypothetical protein
MSLVRRFVSVLALATLLLPSLFSQNSQPSTTQQTQQQEKQKPKCTDKGTYTNSKGETVKRPESCSAAPRRDRSMCGRNL